MDYKIINLSDPLWRQILNQLKYDIYHLPEYVDLEAKRINAIPEAILIFENEKILFLPYLLRCVDNLFEIKTDIPLIWDIVSPYGYPGILYNQAAADTPEFLQLAVNQLILALRDRQICSAFLRLHPILNQGLNEVFPFGLCQISGETVSVDLSLSTAEIWHQTRPEHRNHINRCKRHGFSAKMVRLEEYIDKFMAIYHETMNRVEAKNYFYFDENYFQNLAKLDKNIHLCLIEFNDTIACAGIFTECCEIVQYHLGGTKNEFLKQAPSKLMFDYVRFWAKERGNKFLHLGGGVGSTKDSLYNFKAGFSKQRHLFLTLRLITDQEKYNSLVELRAKTLKTAVKNLVDSNFFPAYRSLN